MSAVNDGKCSPWVMCSCSVVRGNQIRDRFIMMFLSDSRSDGTHSLQSIHC